LAIDVINPFPIPMDIINFNKEEMESTPIDFVLIDVMNPEKAASVAIDVWNPEEEEDATYPSRLTS
jgi:hypothetical protein